MIAADSPISTFAFGSTRYGTVMRPATFRGYATDAGFGSEVTLWGNASNGAVLGIDEVAQAAGTVGYELMCALALRVPVVVA